MKLRLGALLGIAFLIVPGDAFCFYMPKPISPHARGGEAQAQSTQKEPSNEVVKAVQNQIANKAIESWSTNEIKALTQDQIKALTPAQVRALTQDQIKTLTPDQLEALTHDQVEALTPVQMQDLSAGQLLALREGERKRLNAIAEKKDEDLKLLPDLDIINTAEGSQKLSLSVFEYHIRLPFAVNTVTPVILRTSPPLKSSITKETVSDSILNPDGGVVNFAMGPDIVLSANYGTFFPIRLGIKAVEMYDMNNAAKYVPVGQVVFAPTVIWPMFDKEDSKEALEIGTFMMEFPIVINYTNDSAYKALFGKDASSLTAHLEGAVRLFVSQQAIFSFGGTIYTSNQDVGSRIFLGLSVKK